MLLEFGKLTEIPKQNNPFSHSISTMTMFFKQNKKNTTKGSTLYNSKKKERQKKT